MERSLQAAEILQAVGQKRDGDRAQWMKAAGLKEIERITVRKNKIRCTVSVMMPIGVHDGPTVESGSGSSEAVQTIAVAVDGDRNSKRKRKAEVASKEEPHRFSAGELVIGIIDDCTASTDNLSACTALKHLLHTMTQGAGFIPLNSVGLVKEEVTVQPTLLAIATEALGALSDYILPVSVSVSLSDPSEVLLTAQDGPEVGHLAVKTGAAAALSPVAVTSLDAIATDNIAAASVVSEGPQVTRAGTAVPLKLSIVGGCATSHPRCFFVCRCYSLSPIVILTHPRSLSPTPGHSAGGAVGAYMAMILEVCESI